MHSSKFRRKILTDSVSVKPKPTEQAPIVFGKNKKAMKDKKAGDEVDQSFCEKLKERVEC